MKLSKIIGMTAALLVGAGMTSAVMADDDRGHRGGKRGEHAKRGQDRRGNASDRIAEIKKRAMAAKKRVAAKGGQRRGPQGGPPQFAREMMQKRIAVAKGGRGQAGPPQHVVEMWKKRREAAQRGGRGPQARGGFKGQLSRRGKEGGPPAGMREMMKKRIAAAKGGRGQAGPPQHVVEMWKKRREAAQRGRRGPQARGGFKGLGGSRDPQARGGHDGPRGPKGRQARVGRDGHRDSKGRHSRRGGRRGHRR